MRGLRAYKVAAKAESRVRRFPSVLQPADVSSLSFEIGGQLKAVTLTVGQKVQLGDVLAEIDPRSLQSQVEQASAGVQQAQAQLDNAEGDFQRKEELLKRGVATQAVFDQSRATLLSSRAQLDQARRQLELANHNLDRSKLLGAVRRHHRPRRSQILCPGRRRTTHRVTLYSDDRFEMSFLAPSPTFQSLKVGQAVDVKIADMPDLSLKGEIRELGVQGRAGIGLFRWSSRLDNSAPGLNAGMSVEVSDRGTLDRRRKRLLLVPLSVLVARGRQGAAEQRAPCSVYDEWKLDGQKARHHGRREFATIVLVVTEGHRAGDIVASAGRLLSGPMDKR